MDMKTLIFIIYIKILILLGLLGSPIMPVESIVIPEIQSIELNQLEKEVNQYRLENGFNILEASECLRDRATMRLGEIKTQFSHIRPNGNYSVSEKYCGATKRGENLARDIIDPAFLILAWQKSPTHNAVLLNPKYKKIGIFIEGEYAVLEVSN